MPASFKSDKDGKDPLVSSAELLGMLGLADRMACYPRHLSAGEQNCAVIARSLMNETKILLADEPTVDLDEKTENVIMELLQDFHDTDVTILMITHSIGLVPYATRAYSMHKGKLNLVEKAATRKKAKE
jgi:ABC-type lipoprotein export system ATPase subunit